MRRARAPQPSGRRKTSQKEAKEHTEPGDKIRAAVKNLRHISFCTLVVSSPEGSRNQASHLDPDREVQTRIVIDAIVSNKTFANATALLWRANLLRFQRFLSAMSATRFVQNNRLFNLPWVPKPSVGCFPSAIRFPSFLPRMMELWRGRAILEKPSVAPDAAEPT